MVCTFVIAVRRAATMTTSSSCLVRSADLPAIWNVIFGERGGGDGREVGSEGTAGLNTRFRRCFE